MERIDVALKGSFSGITAAMEKNVPKADISEFVQMVTSGLNAQEIEHAVGGMVRDLGFMVLVKIDQGPLASVLGKQKKMSLFLIGNPVLANGMYEHHPGAGLFAPLRALIYEDYQGTCHFTYERPSTVLEHFSNDAIRSVARVLDQKMELLAERLARC